MPRGWPVGISVGPSRPFSVSGRPFLTAEWRHLLLLNYEVPPELLEPHLPAGTELDRWEGIALASVVGFLFVDTRLLGLRVPGHRLFEEVNLRFYVRRRGPDGKWRRAVVFLREVVPHRSVAWIARMVYHEPYRRAPMGHRLRFDPAGRGEAAYHWDSSRGRCQISGRVDTQPTAVEAGSEAEYITEHYWGYTRQRDGGTLEYRVDHPRWNTAPLTNPRLEGNLTPWYGDRLAQQLGSVPRSGYYADGSPVSVFRGARVR